MESSTFDSWGYDILEGVYSPKELEVIEKYLEEMKVSAKFGQRDFLVGHEELTKILLNHSLRNILKKHTQDGLILTKSIFFNKPLHANWVVPWHQDLTINVSKKLSLSFPFFKKKGNKKIESYYSPSFWSKASILSAKPFAQNPIIAHSRRR